MSAFLQLARSAFPFDDATLAALEAIRLVEDAGWFEDEPGDLEQRVERLRSMQRSSLAAGQGLIFDFTAVLAEQERPVGGGRRAAVDTAGRNGQTGVPGRCVELLRAASGLKDRREAFERVLAAHSPSVRSPLPMELPAVVCDLLVAIAEPATGPVIDPWAGCGGLLLSIARSAGMEASLVGDEEDPVVRAVMEARLSLHRVRAQVAAHGIVRDVRRGRTARAVICNALDRADRARLPLDAADSRWIAGVPSRGWAFAWMQHAVSLLSDESSTRATVLTQAGITAAGGRDARIRDLMVELGIVEAVVALPEFAVRTRGRGQSVVWSLRSPTARPDRSEVLLVDVSGETASGESDWDRLGSLVVGALRSFRSGAYEDLDPQIAAAVPSAEIRAANANLTPARWTASSDLTGLLEEVVLPLKSRHAQDIKQLGVQADRVDGIDVVTRALEPSTVKLRRLESLVEVGLINLLRGVAIDRDKADTAGLPVWRQESVPGAPRRRSMSDDHHDLPITEAGDVVIERRSLEIRAVVDVHGGHIVPLPAVALRSHVGFLPPHLLAALINASPSIGLVGSTRFGVAVGDIEIPVLEESEALAADALLRALDDEFETLRRLAKTNRDLADALARGVGRGVLDVFGPYGAASLKDVGIREEEQ